MQAELHLAGVRVLDFSLNLPGPYCTMLLASMGAEVIKIEPPRGDPARLTPRLFEHVNGGKQSVVLDLGREADRKRAEALVEWADVVIEGFRPGVMERFGLGPSLRDRKPSLIYCSISAYGQNDPRREEPAHDLNLQALAGVCHEQRDERERPQPVALPIADLSAGLSAAARISAAVAHRARTGEGATLDLTLGEALERWTEIWADGLMPSDGRASSIAEPARRWLDERSEDLPEAVRGLALLAGEVLGSELFARGVDAVGERLKDSRVYRALERRKLFALPHYGLFECADGRWLALGIVDESKFWRALCEALDLPTLAVMPLAARIAGGPLVRRSLEQAFRQRPLDEWLRTLDLRAIPVSAVRTTAEALGERRPRARAPRLGEHGDRAPR